MASTSSTSSSSSSSLSSSSISSLPIVVVGGGLAGTLTALLFARRELPVVLMEFREDFRVKERHDSDKFTSSLKRSVNLALSYRGICALKKAGIFHAIEKHLIPMKGRYIHKPNTTVATTAGETVPVTFQSYGIGDEAIFSISRQLINRLLLDQLDQYPNIKAMFEVKVSRVERDGTVFYRLPGQSHLSEQSIKSAFVIGADGAFSVIRSSLLRYDRIDYSLNYIEHGYKELTIPPAASGDFALENWQGLHIWPHSEFMLIALPNPDKSFTATLFAPFNGNGGLDTLRTSEQITAHFQKYFPDAFAVMPTLVTDFQSSPSSPLLTVRVSKFHYEDKIVILGDAAHATVPFLGQGMNAAFEDGLVLDELYDEYKGDIQQALAAFSVLRVPSTQALADLSLANYKEMSHDVASTWFLIEKKVENLLRTVFPKSYIPKYSMVQFTRIPYHLGIQKAKKQERIVKFTAAAAAVALLGSTVWIATKLLGTSNEGGNTSNGSGTAVVKFGSSSSSGSVSFGSVWRSVSNLFSSLGSVEKGVQV